MTREVRTTYEQFLLTGTAPASSPSAGRRGGRHLDQLHLGHDRAPEGRHVHAPRAFLNALGEVIETGLRYDSVYLWTLPMFHCNGWCFPWAVTASAARHVCLRKVEPALVWELLEREGVTHFNGAPTVLIGS